MLSIYIFFYSFIQQIINLSKNRWGRVKDLNIFEFFLGGNTRGEVVNLLCKNPCEIFINGRSSGRGRKLIAFFVRCNTQHYYKFMT